MRARIGGVYLDELAGLYQGDIVQIRSTGGFARLNAAHVSFGRKVEERIVSVAVTPIRLRPWWLRWLALVDAALDPSQVWLPLEDISPLGLLEQIAWAAK